MWRDDSEGSVGKRFTWKPQSPNVYVDVCVLFLWASLNLQLSKPSQRQQKCFRCPWPLKTSFLTAGWSCNLFLIRTNTLPKSLWSQLLETKHPISALVLLIRQSWKDCRWVWPSVSFAPALSQHSLVLPVIFHPQVVCSAMYWLRPFNRAHTIGNGGFCWKSESFVLSTLTTEALE